jgi:hypothetical protein
VRRYGECGEEGDGDGVGVGVGVGDGRTEMPFMW